MPLPRPEVILPLISLLLLCNAPDAAGLTLYRVGSPFSTTEKDSLQNIGVDYRELTWSASLLEHDLQPDSLQAGKLQPNFFDVSANIAVGTLNRGGFINVFLFASENSEIGQVMLDGDPTTAYIWEAIDPEQFANDSFGWIKEKQPETATIDLGGVFRVSEVRFRPLKEHPEHFIEHFRIGVSDENRRHGRGSGIGSAFYEPILEVVENTKTDVIAVLDEPVETRYIQLQIVRVTGKAVGIAELEIFGGGFVSRAAYETDVIELDDIASLGKIRWSGQRAPNAHIDIRTRSGSDPHPDIFWLTREEQQDSVRFLRGGGNMSMAEYKNTYDKLDSFFKPEDPRHWVSPDTQNWGFWSSAYLFENPGVDILSLGTRQYFQLRVDFVSNIAHGGHIDYLEFEASSPPAVRRLLAEISPTQTAVGDPTHFTYYIKPTIRSGDSSFDGIEIFTPSRLVTVDSLRIDGINQEDFAWQLTDDGLGFEVQLPRRLETTDSGALIEIVFNTPVLREVGTQFDGRVFDSEKTNEVRQRVTPGNAAAEISSDQLSVTTELSQSLVFSPQIAPNPFTPNGDGVNDVVNISYKLLRLTSAVPIAIEIFDLSGRLVKQVYTGEDPLGDYAHIWDGTDSANQLVPPGLYLYHIVADLESGKETSSGILAVAY